MSLAVRHERIGPEGAPRLGRILHVSDLHLWRSNRVLREIDEAMARWQPDIAALTGDYADTPWGQEVALTWVGELARKLPVCWIAGNHDRWWGEAFLRRLGAIEGAHAIDRADTWLRGSEGSGIRFTTWSRRRCPGDPAPTVVLMHDPSIIGDGQPDDGEYVILAGHLHGGQVTLWHDRHGRPQPAGMFYRRLDGRVALGPSDLIVSRGVGDTLPIRFRVPREIVIVDLLARKTRAKIEPAPDRMTHSRST